VNRNQKEDGVITGEAQKAAIRQAAKEELDEVVEKYSHLIGEKPATLWKNGVHGRVFEILAKYDPLIPNNEQENLQRLNDLLLGAIPIHGGLLYEDHNQNTPQIPDQFLMIYDSENQTATIIGVVEVKINPLKLKDKLSRFKKDPLSLLADQIEEVNSFLSESARGHYISPPVRKLLVGSQETIRRCLAIPRGDALARRGHYRHWEIVESTFSLEEIKAITLDLFMAESRPQPRS
jgi:hypothetical protein